MAPPHNPNQPFPFFSLPTELRTNIYTNIYHSRQDLLTSLSPTTSPWKHIDSTTWEFPWKKYNKWKTKREMFLRTNLLLVSHRFRHEFLDVWALCHRHEVRLNLGSFYTVKDAIASNTPYASTRKVQQHLSTEKISEALWLRLRSFLQNMEARYGVANRVRCIQLHAKITSPSLHSSALSDPLSIVQSLALQHVAENMQRFDEDLVHPELRVDLEILVTTGINYWDEPPSGWQARRRGSMRQVFPPVLRASQEWVCQGDVVEQWVCLPPEEEVGKAVVWQWVVVET